MHLRGLTTAAFLGIAAVLGLPPLVDGASFPCSAPALPRERLICSDLRLSRADEKLVATFQAALKVLSEEGRAALRQGQRDWLKFTDTICTTRHPKGPAEGQQSSADCLDTSYRARQKVLDAAVIKSGGRVIRRVDIFRAEAWPGGGGEFPGFATTIVAYPQIDTPRDEQEKQWNKLVIDHSGADALARAAVDPDDYAITVDYALGSVSTAMISLRLYRYDYGGGAHGTASDQQINWLLRQDRDLRAEDVFDAHQNWDAALARLAFDKAKRDAEHNHEDFPFQDPSDIEQDVINPAHWLIAEHSLDIRFDIDAFPHVIEADLPWSLLKPYLLSPLPFAITAK